MKYTKSELKQAMYMLLTDVLPNMRCEKVEKKGNWDCCRCDDCMFEQYIKKVQQNYYTDKNGFRRCNLCTNEVERGRCEDCENERGMKNEIN